MTYFVCLLLAPASLLLLVCTRLPCIHIPSAAGCYGCEEGDVRLAGGSDISGRVELCHGGEWGTVCDDYWDSNDARVVCRQLGLPTNVTLALSSFGGGSGAILLDNVECSGLEEQLWNCSHRGIGVHNCEHKEDAGVTCASGIGQDGEKQCENNDSESEVTREEVERFGNCVLHETHEPSITCDAIYTPGVDYIYVSYQRTGGSLDTYLDIIERVAGLVIALFRDECRDLAIRIVCHYFLPPCGNSTTFKPPTSVCMETCNYLRETCPNAWNAVLAYYEANEDDARTYGATFNCSDTGVYLNPLPHCCSNLGIDISCTTVDGTGEVAPDPSCLNSTVPDLSAQPSPSLTMSTDSSQQTSGSLAVALGSVCATVAILFFMVISAVSWILIKKHRQTKKKKQQMSEPSTCARLNTVEGQEASFCYHGNGNLLQAPSLVPVKRARVKSSFVRQMNEEKLLIPERNIHLQDCVGQGEFGIVYRAILSGWRGKKPELIAVKTLNGVFRASELSTLVEESLKMSKFNHPNVMRLVGVCIDGGESPYIVMPFMTHGNLLSYLRKHRAELTIANSDNVELVTTAQKKLLSMCLQIAKGMSYLAKEKFVHRDLAARNCMIDNNFVIKVADFGLTEDIYAKNDFRQLKPGGEGEDQVKLPVRWMAVESLNDGVFTEKTDVWSFGVTCWEVFSLGKSPYPGMDPFTLIKHLERGERLEKPVNTACSLEIFDIMKECWKELPDKRPTFFNLEKTISIILERISGYLDLTASPLTPAGNCESRSSHVTVTVTDKDNDNKEQIHNPN